jgi:cytochrome c556
VLGAFVALATPSFAAEDPIAARKALMRSNSAAAAVANAMIRIELAYSPIVGRAVIAALGATAATLPDLFPEGSGTGTTRAAPAIWTDAAGFAATLAGFQDAVAGAREASGADGPPDLAAFTAAVEPALGFCSTCHRAYRLPAQ